MPPVTLAIGFHSSALQRAIYQCSDNWFVPNKVHSRKAVDISLGFFRTNTRKTLNTRKLSQTKTQCFASIKSWTWLTENQVGKEGGGGVHLRFNSTANTGRQGENDGMVEVPFKSFRSLAHHRLQIISIIYILLKQPAALFHCCNSGENPFCKFYVQF